MREGEAAGALCRRLPCFDNTEAARGASSLTPKQLREYAIDSQVLFAITLPLRFEACLANKKSFDMIRAIEFAAPKDFISLKP